MGVQGVDLEEARLGHQRYDSIPTDFAVDCLL